MKDHKFKKLIIEKCRISKIAHLDTRRPIKDIKTNKYTSEAPSLDRISLKIAQRSRNKPSMPKMPWEI